MLSAQSLLANGKSTFEQWLRRCVATLRAMSLGQTAQGTSHIEMVGSLSLFPDGEGT